jgi:hypothetical protein
MCAATCEHDKEHEAETSDRITAHDGVPAGGPGGDDSPSDSRHVIDDMATPDLP